MRMVFIVFSLIFVCLFVCFCSYSQKHKTLNPINSGQVNKNSDVNKKYQIWLENNVTAEIPDNFINKVDSSSEAMKRLEQEALVNIFY